MERIALISDIHGNFTALEAVIKDIRRRRIKRIICLGDLAGKGPQPAECADKVRDFCETVLQGNWDRNLTLPPTKESVQWQQAQLGIDRLNYLSQLPFSVDLQLSGKRIRLFHASSTSIDHRVTRKASRKEKLAMFEHTEKTGYPRADTVTAAEESTGTSEAGGQAPPLTPDVVGYGDLHIPFVQTIKNKLKKGLILFNTGSVGAPYDGIPQACYSILEGEPESAVDAPFGIQTVRVPYDIGQAVAIAEQLQMPGIERFRYEMTTGLEQ